MPAETLKEPCTKNVLDGFVVLIPTRPDPLTWSVPLTLSDRLFALSAADMDNRLDSVPPVILSFCPSAAVNVLLFPVMMLDCVVLSFVPPDMESILPESVVLSADCLESIPFIQLFCVVLSDCSVDILPPSVVLSDSCFVSRLPILPPALVRLSAMVWLFEFILVM